MKGGGRFAHTLQEKNKEKKKKRTGNASENTQPV